MALFPRLISMVGRYDALAQIVEQEQNIVDQVLGLTSAARVGDQAKRQLSVAGAETMYLASAALLLQGNLERLIRKIDSMGIAGQISYMSEMRQRSQDLQHRFIDKLVDVYRTKYKATNSRIIMKGPTDWSYATYPDAKFAEEAFSRIKSWQNKVN